MSGEIRLVPVLCALQKMLKGQTLRGSDVIKAPSSMNRCWYGLAWLWLVVAAGCATTSWSALPTTDISPDRKSRDLAVVAAFERKRARAEYEAAVARLEEGNLEAAEEQLRRLLGYRPDHTAGSLRLAEIYLATDRFADAFDLLQPLVRKESENAEVQHAMALLLEACGQPSGAVVYYRRAAELAPDNEIYALDYETALWQNSKISSCFSRRPIRAQAAPDENDDVFATEGIDPSDVLTGDFSTEPLARRETTPRLPTRSHQASYTIHGAGDSHGTWRSPPLTAAPVTEQQFDLQSEANLASDSLSIQRVDTDPFQRSTAFRRELDDSVFVSDEIDESENPMIATAGLSSHPSMSRQSQFAAEEADDRAGQANKLREPLPLAAQEKALSVGKLAEGTTHRDRSTPPQNAKPTTHDLEGWIFQTRHLLRHGALKAALARCRQAVASDPDNPQIPIMAATLLIEHNEPEAAIVLLEEPLQRFPRNAALHRILGVAYYRAGSYTQSVSELRRSLSLDKSNALSYFLLGSALDKVGRHREAVQHYRHAVRLDPSLSLTR